MAQPTPVGANGASTPSNDENGHLAVPGKRKRDSKDGAVGAEMTSVEEQKPAAPHRWAAGEQKDLIKSYFDVLKSIDVEPAILKRPLGDRKVQDEPDTKRQKSSDPSSVRSISDKIAADSYTHIEHVASDVVSATDAALSEIRARVPDGSGSAGSTKLAVRIAEFKAQALAIMEREKAYPRVATSEAINGQVDSKAASCKSQAILSVVGYAPQERRLFSSLPLSQDIDLTELNLPPGVSFSRLVPANTQERTQTLGELFSPPRPLPPLQPPKQPKTQAKGNTLDFYHPDLADTATYRGACYFGTKLSSGYYLDYSNATPSYQTKTKQRERAQSLAGKKPSTSELEMSEMESLFRGAFSTFAPCKDDSGAVIPSGTVGKMWWHKSGSKNFQRMIEVEYYPDIADVDAFHPSPRGEELDEDAVQEAIDNWDDDAVDPSLEDAMGTKRDQSQKEVDDVLDEVSDLIGTLASYQRIRNLTLPNSQNRQSSDPVNGDMLANSGPQPSEEEQATYEMLKAQLALIIKTLPPYAVAKLNGDQLDDLLISTKIQVRTDQYRGVMEEDDAGQQQQQQQQHVAAQAAQAAQANARPPLQRSASISTPYANQYQHPPQYGTPTRTPSHPQQYFRSMPTPNYHQPRTMGSPAPQHPRPPQPNQYTRPNGYPNQYATQLAKAQTPYGHQNMPQAHQQRPPQYGQLQQQGVPNATRFQYQQQFQQQPPPQPPPPGPPGQPNYGAYMNGAGMPPRNMSPQVPPRHPYSPSPNMQQAQQRFGTPGQGNPQMARHASNPGPHPQYNQSPGLTGYHTVIPEAQQQRILEQAKARVAAQERTAMFGDKMQPGFPGMPMGYGGNVDANRMATARANLMNQQKPQTPVGQRQGINGTPQSQYVPPSKVTPVPVPPIPGAGQQQPQSGQQPPQGFPGLES
ncbi:uncharacterized protein MAM_01072 [Metarhizium album ARSEF 1941]|uniref:Uncharacterized protein n=1 Tax=Metarhizium album (strain ARSEF 1941) TaxID=1081103 RepID=A0A0B2X9R9_METAS|nr:uncharacterized protein MAM_01072 [Metarhizium album ARSEF 1941]KHO02071.1 hypothetical protein MAM_01072 [Metarhizium album ARSEF 1941]